MTESFIVDAVRAWLGIVGSIPFVSPNILHQYGITNLIEMAGGVAAWDAAKLPVVSQG